LTFREPSSFRASGQVPYLVKKGAYSLVQKPNFPLLKELLGRGWGGILLLVFVGFIESAEVSV
jgi:hypothetical protein